MQKIILLVGFSGSGKDYLVNAFHLKPVISHTDRQQRNNELNGYSKHFHDVGFFGFSVDQKKVIAHTVINGCNYWTTKEDLIGKDVYVIDVNGVFYMKYFYKEKFYDKFDIIILEINHCKRFFRLMKRGIKTNQIKKSFIRFFSDFKTFKHIKKIKKLKNCTIIKL